MCSSIYRLVEAGAEIDYEGEAGPNLRLLEGGKPPKPSRHSPEGKLPKPETKADSKPEGTPDPLV